MTRSRAVLLVAFVAIAVYVNSLGNGFAYDDNPIVAQNPVVTTPLLGEAVFGPYWPQQQEGTGLYRPVVVTSFALEWQAYGPRPLGFHLANVIAHALVSVLVYALLARLVTWWAALVGALLFAVHPLHVEAVANVVGRAELYAGGGFLLACLLYLWAEKPDAARNGLRIAGITALYLFALGAKEIAVTLPLVLIVLDLVRAADTPLGDRIRAAIPVHVCLAAALAAYLAVRVSVLGTLAGEVPAPWLQGLDGDERMLTAFSVWPEYLRLLLFPVDLAADYAPGVVTVATGVTAGVVIGALVLLALIGGCALTLRRWPVVSLGVSWFLVTILPVSNLFIPTGVTLAERTLYLPSVGLSLVVAGIVAAFPWDRRPDLVQPARAIAFVVLGLLGVRTVLRNPTWLETYTVLNTLAVEHPESYLSLRARATGLVRVGEVEAAAEAYEAAIALVPSHYAMLVEVAGFHGEHGRWERAEELLLRAVRIMPDQPGAYLRLAEHLVLRGLYRDGHRVALSGLAAAGENADLWGLVSETYVAKGDLDAAIRARRTAAGLADDPSTHWARLAEIYDTTGRTVEAAEARRRASAQDASRRRRRAAAKLRPSTARPRPGAPTPRPAPRACAAECRSTRARTMA